jgi:hypothetical protein
MSLTEGQMKLQFGMPVAETIVPRDAVTVTHHEAYVKICVASCSDVVGVIPRSSLLVP